ILTDQTAPLRKVFRTAEIDGVVFQRLPLHHQPVALRFLDRAVQLKAMKTLCAAEGGTRFCDRCLKILLAAGLDVDLCDFGDHLMFPPVVATFGTGVSNPARPKEKGARRRLRWSRRFRLSLPEQDRAGHHGDAARKQSQRPNRAAAMIPPLRATFADDGALIFI